MRKFASCRPSPFGPVSTVQYAGPSTDTLPHLYHQPRRITTFPKCCADCIYRYAAGASSNEKTLSMIGFSLLTAMARFMASNICVEPTDICLAHWHVEKRSALG